MIRNDAKEAIERLLKKAEGDDTKLQRIEQEFKEAVARIANERYKLRQLRFQRLAGYTGLHS